jgi:hypothetical protein
MLGVRRIMIIILQEGKFLIKMYICKIKIIVLIGTSGEGKENQEYLQKPLSQNYYPKASHFAIARSR